MSSSPKYSICITRSLPVLWLHHWKSSEHNQPGNCNPDIFSLHSKHPWQNPGAQKRSWWPTCWDSNTNNGGKSTNDFGMAPSLDAIVTTRMTWNMFRIGDSNLNLHGLHWNPGRGPYPTNDHLTLFCASFCFEWGLGLKTAIAMAY